MLISEEFQNALAVLSEISIVFLDSKKYKEILIINSNIYHKTLQIPYYLNCNIPNNFKDTLPISRVLRSGSRHNKYNFYVPI